MELKELIKQQKAKGVLVKALAHPSLVIMAQDCGMDFILYDCEHGVLSYEQLHDLMVLGNMRKLSSIVRVAQLARSDVSRILDCGACGVMVPMIETAGVGIAFMAKPIVAERAPYRIETRDLRLVLEILD